MKTLLHLGTAILIVVVTMWSTFGKTLPAHPPKPFKVLIIDGQTNHRNMKEGTAMMKGYLEETGLFTVDVVTSPKKGTDLSTFRPDFQGFDVILSNYNGDEWSPEVKDAFERFVQNGGGLVVVHSADNAFPKWEAYNKMIGIGGWEGRDEKSGPWLYYDESKQAVVKDSSAGIGGSHGNQHEFIVKTREAGHPIMKDLPAEWLHQKDELYDRLRGPADNITVLATAYSAKEQNGSGRNEPVLMVLQYGKGRIFHTTLGHETYSQKCVGFITTLQRGTEWAATGKVTQKIPASFPTATQGISR
ncbi:ThuA domain-containing protein [Dyadobacter sandarakinus]|uniref:ThuA domain-containing protein n=1 Tax=Dyadobacter sandarakinus TaxID=2747268 RepID=A0ABX7I324_9BACT|nr:ThuA domain-containing protein [Dyadobacter sandarakinus]QRR00459.1 ThuA domain-containing protein [Dyadobacter sandarakinus]